MKLATVGESPADALGIRALCQSFLRAIEEWPQKLMVRGWPHVRDVLPAVMLELHYATDVEAWIVVADSNGSDPHQVTHVAAIDAPCRVCALQAVVDATRRRLRPTGRPEIRVAVAVPSPCLEAWLLSGRDPHVTEAAWVNGLREARLPYDCNELKRRFYGTDRPSLALEIDTIQAQRERLVADLPTLRQNFPIGFDRLAVQLSGWVAALE